MPPLMIYFKEMLRQNLRIKQEFVSRQLDVKMERGGSVARLRVIASFLLIDRFGKTGGHGNTLKHTQSPSKGFFHVNCIQENLSECYS